jgi:DNA-binding beta-propeller fold protein YncE
VRVSTGIIITLAGSGNCGYSGDGGLAVSATLEGPRGVAVDTSGNVFIVDSSNHRVRKFAQNSTACMSG